MTTTKFDLTKRKMKLRKRVARRKLMKDLALGLVVACGVAMFTALFVRTWEQEIDAHGEYNRQYQLEKSKTGK